MLLLAQGIIIADADKAPRPAYPTNEVGVKMETSPTWLAGALGLALSGAGCGIIFMMDAEREKKAAESPAPPVIERTHTVRP